VASFVGAAPLPVTDEHGRILRHMTTTTSLKCTARNTTPEGDRNPLREHQVKIKIFDALLLERLLLSFRIDLTDKSELLQCMRRVEEQRERWYVPSDRARVYNVIEHMKSSCLVREVDNNTGRPTLAMDHELVGLLEAICAGWEHIELLWTAMRDIDHWDALEIQLDVIRNAQVAVTSLARHARALAASIGYDVATQIEPVLLLALSTWRFKSRPRIFAAVPCGYTAKLCRFSNAPDVLVFGLCQPHAENCQVIHDTSLQRLPHSIKEQVISLLNAGLNNRQVLTKVNNDHQTAICVTRQGSGRMQVTMDDIGNLRARYGKEGDAVAGNGGGMFKISSASQV
jgi:hypothetical protein